MSSDSLININGTNGLPPEQFVFPELPKKYQLFFSENRSFETRTFIIPEALSSLIDISSKNKGISDETLLFGALSVVLSRYCDQRSLIITSAEFRAPETGGEICVSNIEVFTDESLSFVDFCSLIYSRKGSQVNYTMPENTGDFITHDNSAKLQFSPVLFIHGGIKYAESLISHLHNSNSELVFTIDHTDNRLSLSISFDSLLFTSAFIIRLFSHFFNTLDKGLQSQSTPLSDIEILSDEEMNTILGTWNSTAHEIPEYISLSDLFDLQALSQPDAPALLTDGSSMNFRELLFRVNSLASLLISKGIGNELPVAVCIERSAELTISILAIIKAGGTYVPLDPSYPLAHIKLILDDCRPGIVLTNDSHKSLFDISETEIICLNDYLFDNISDVKTFRNAPLGADSRFYIMYTSGSSGKPKGVEGVYRGILNRLYWMWDTYPYIDTDICCNRTPAGFVDHIAEILAPLCKGVPLVTVPEHAASSADSFAEFIAQYRISRILVVPSLLQSMLQCDTEILLNLTSLKYVFSSGEALDASLVKLFYQHIRSARLVNIYGSTEISADATYHEVRRFFPGDVLQYFTQSLDLPGGLKETLIDDYSNPIKTDRITSENVPIELIASKFRSSHIADYPLTPAQYFKRLYSDVFPYVINTAAPTFIGHMTSALPDFVHDLSKLISQLNQNLVKIETAKSLIFLEREALAILHRSFYNKEDSFYDKYIQKLNANLGLVTTGGTTANITALLTARNRALFTTYECFSSSGKSIYRLLREKGYEDMTILGTHRMHYSIRKAISVLGLGIDTIMYVDTDESGRLDTADLEKKILLCQERKILVFAVIGIAGATETGQIDPLDEIGKIAQKYRIHFHVDAAWGGTTIFSEKYRHRLDGINRADSITFCGHKQLYLPQGISICLFKDPDQLRFATTTASYQASSDSYDVGKFTLEGSRSAISLCLHAALQLIGKKGYESLVNYSMDLTAFFVKSILSSTAFELVGTPDLNIVNYRYIPLKYRDKVLHHTLSATENMEINEFNREIQERQFLKGKTFVSKTILTHTKHSVGEVVVFRVVLSNPLTTYADLYEVLEDQLSIASEISPQEHCAKLGDHYQITVLHESSQSSNDNVSTYATDEKLIPIGKPLYNTKAIILDSRRHLQPEGIPGELYIGGSVVARGYYNNPKLTQSSFIENPFGKGERIFKTGDRARFLEDGTIEFLGRLDDQVKISGYRIEPSEIEYNISAMDCISQCKVAAVTAKNGSKKLVAWLMLRKDTSAEEIRKDLQGKLPEYMIPSEFRVIEKFPLLPNGKIDKKVLLSL